jgi:hypothetical protein
MGWSPWATMLRPCSFCRAEVVAQHAVLLVEQRDERAQEQYVPAVRARSHDGVA